MQLNKLKRKVFKHVHYKIIKSIRCPYFGGNLHFRALFVWFRPKHISWKSPKIRIFIFISEFMNLESVNVSFYILLRGFLSFLSLNTILNNNLIQLQLLALGERLSNAFADGLDFALLFNRLINPSVPYNELIGYAYVLEADLNTFSIKIGNNSSQYLENIINHLQIIQQILLQPCLTICLYGFQLTC